MTVTQTLRAATANDHDRVDAVFAGYDLADRSAYAAFLLAHVRALPAAEAVLATRALPKWRPRTPLLTADLVALGKALPDPLPFALAPGDAAALGALYVVEGSRLGGVMLARRVGRGLPAGYLGARHEPGEWRTLLTAIDAMVDEGDAAEAVEGARMTFALYAAAGA